VAEIAAALGLGDAVPLPRMSWLIGLLFIGSNRQRRKRCRSGARRVLAANLIVPCDKPASHRHRGHAPASIAARFAKRLRTNPDCQLTLWQLSGLPPIKYAVASVSPMAVSG
jgi:hypothetical protein